MDLRIGRVTKKYRFSYMETVMKGTVRTQADGVFYNAIWLLFVGQWISQTGGDQK